MNRSALLLAICLALIPGFSRAESAPSFSLGYQWSLSGKQYATVNTALREDWIAKGLTFNAVAGYETKTGTTPSFGFGITYRIDYRPAFLEAGAFVLFPQQSRPDVGIGLQFGVKF